MVTHLLRHATAATLAATLLSGCDDPPMRLDRQDESFAEIGLITQPEIVQGRKATFGRRQMLLVEVRGNGMVRVRRKNGAAEAYDYRSENTTHIPDLPVILHCDRATLQTQAGVTLKPVPAASTCNGAQRMQSGAGRDIPAYLAFELPKPSGRLVLDFALPVEVVAPDEDEWQVARDRLSLWDDATFEIVRKKSVPPLLGTRQATATFIAQPVPGGRGLFARFIDALP